MNLPARIEELLKPWLTVGGVSLVRRLELEVSPYEPDTWSEIFRFFQAEIELVVRGYPNRVPTWNGESTTAWTGVLLQQDSMVSCPLPPSEGPGFAYRGSVGRILQVFPVLYGLEPTFFLAYRFAFHGDIYRLRPQLGVMQAQDARWTHSGPCRWYSDIERAPIEPEFPEELPPLPAKLKLALELGGVSCYLEDPRTALDLALSWPRPTKTFKIRTEEQMREKGRWVEPPPRDGTRLIARITSRWLSRS